MNAKKGSWVVYDHLHRAVCCQHFGWHPCCIQPFPYVEIVNRKVLEEKDSQLGINMLKNQAGHVEKLIQEMLRLKNS